MEFLDRNFMKRYKKMNNQLGLCIFTKAHYGFRGVVLKG